jgi:hypothetical protein
MYISLNRYNFTTRKKNVTNAKEEVGDCDNHDDKGNDIMRRMN